MNHLKTNPVGIDVEIEKAQVLLYDDLSSLWGTELDGYGRVYKNNRGDKVVPEVYLSGKDYSGTLFTTDQSKFFFYKGSSSDHNGLDYEYKSDLNIYFILDLSKTHPTITHRADQEAQADVLRVLDITGLYVKKIIDTDSGDIFREFKEVKIEDSHPYHIFKCECELVYDLIKN